MHKTTYPFLFVICLFLTGCSTIRSSVNYTNGTSCLEEGDYANAVIYLKKAVQLDPCMSRNQTNLSAAYCALGEFDMAWYHARLAVICIEINPNQKNQPAYTNFFSLYNHCVKEKGLDRVGTLLEEVIDKLGKPDFSRQSDDGTEEDLFYGIYGMRFKDGKLVSCELIELSTEIL